MDSKSVENDFEAARIRKRMVGFQKFRVLKALRAFLEIFAFAECKTIGNGHPEGLHCFACTFGDILDRVNRAVRFWEEQNRYEDTLS